MATWTPSSKNSTSFTPVSKSSAPSYSNTTKSLTANTFILLESNSYILLETGDKIILDQSAASAISWTGINKS